MFGNNNNNNISSGFKFGGNSASNSGGFSFGNNNANTNTSGGFSFGNNNNTNNNTNSNTSGGFSFGNNNNNNNNTSTGLFNKPATSAGFGNTASNAPKPFNFGSSNSSASKPAFSFGNTSNTASATKPAFSFGNNSNTTSATKPGFSFGSNTGGGMFGNNNNTNSGGMFGNTNNTNTGGMFGNNNNNTTPKPQLTSMTKVSDLPEPFRKQLEELDTYIQTQVAISEYLKNNEKEHAELIESIPRDIGFLEKKCISTNQALNSDLKFIEEFKTKTLESFNDWVEKLIQVYLQLTNPMSSNSGNDQAQNTAAQLVLGVNGTRGDAEKVPVVARENAPLNMTQILNSYYVAKIDEFKDSIGKYQLVLQEVENSVNDLDKASLSGAPVALGGNYGLQMVVQTLKEEFQLYVELANEFAEVHNRVSRLK